MNSTFVDGQSRESGLSHVYVDGLLRSFMKKEMPEPWPEAKLPVAAAFTRGNRQPFSFRAFGRLALVASVALILIGYLTLAGLFPAERKSGLTLDRIHTIGKRVPTPHGGEALLWEETVRAAPGARPTIIIHALEIKSPQKR